MSIHARLERLERGLFLASDRIERLTDSLRASYLDRTAYQVGSTGMGVQAITNTDFSLPLFGWGDASYRLTFYYSCTGDPVANAPVSTTLYHQESNGDATPLASQWFYTDSEGNLDITFQSIDKSDPDSETYNTGQWVGMQIYPPSSYYFQGVYAQAFAYESGFFVKTISCYPASGYVCAGASRPLAYRWALLADDGTTKLTDLYADGYSVTRDYSVAHAISEYTSTSTQTDCVSGSLISVGTWCLPCSIPDWFSATGTIRVTYTLSLSGGGGSPTLRLQSYAGGPTDDQYPTVWDRVAHPGYDFGLPSYATDSTPARRWWDHTLTGTISNLSGVARITFDLSGLPFPDRFLDTSQLVLVEDAG